jgi:hypothetical protein
VGAEKEQGIAGKFAHGDGFGASVLFRDHEILPRPFSPIRLSTETGSIPALEVTLIENGSKAYRLLQ